MVWDEYEDDRLTDLIFSTNLSTREIAMELGVEELEVKKEMRNLGLTWVRRNKGHVSRGQAALMTVMTKLLPGETIKTEEHIGERLRLDIFCPAYNLAAEYHGRQHFFYTEHFHGDKEGFLASQARDERKIEICNDLGIALVVFRYNDDMSEETVYSRMLTAIRETPVVKEEKQSNYKGKPYYEKFMQQKREYRKEQYRKMKRQQGRG